jgi:hypothetical protein
MFEVFVNTGVSQGFNVNVDRIPVAGDFILYKNASYLVESTYLSAGGGTRVIGKIQSASAKPSSKRTKTAGGAGSRKSRG